MNFAVWALILTLAPAPLWAATVVIDVSNVKTPKGAIRAALCADEESYLKGACMQGMDVKAEKNTTEVRFENVPPGTYGVQLFHDRNGNGKLDFNFLHIPKEGYAFSNNIRPQFSQPAFKKIAFAVSEATVKISVSLIN